MSNEYHHGDLKNALVREGIRIVNEEGIEKLSMRKVAAACGVSHAAPKTHFENKEALLQEMRRYASEQLADELSESAKKGEKQGAAEAIVALGKQYIRFFMQHVDYFQFFFCQEQADTIHLNLDVDDENDFAPFRVFRSHVIKYNESLKERLSEKELEVLMIRIWVIVQGIASIIGMENVIYEGDWMELVEQLVR